MFVVMSASVRVNCSSSKGFGSSNKGDSTKKPKDVARLNRGESKVVDKAVRLVDRKTFPVNPDEAAQGKVDFVKVKDWGSGIPEDLGSLEVQSAVSSTNLTFNDQLMRQLETLQAQGSLSVAQPKDAKPLPPFERWAFAREHYLQYLTDLLCVHKAIDSSIQQLLLSGQLQGEPAAALSTLTTLQRSQHIQTDLNNMMSSGAADRSLDPLPNAIAYAQLIQTIAQQCNTASTPQEANQQALRLLTHAYILLLTLLGSGTRIGATAAEKLNLFAADALHTYRDFGELGQQQPLEVLVGAVNELGLKLSESDKEVIMEELPISMQRASLILEALARG